MLPLESLTEIKPFPSVVVVKEARVVPAAFLVLIVPFPPVFAPIRANSLPLELLTEMKPLPSVVVVKEARVFPAAFLVSNAPFPPVSGPI